MPMIRTLRPARKHLALLAGLVAILVVQPLVGHRALAAGVFCDVVLFAICLYIFFIVFGGRKEMPTALMPLGYGARTPVGSPSYKITWLEVMCGQFCMAVGVAQLVGLKLAQALRGDRPESK